MLDSSLLVSEGVKKLTPYVPGKPLEELERELGIVDAIKMASNENSLGPSPKALEAIKDSLATIHRYPDADCRLLKAKLSKRFGVPEACIVPSNGSNEIIELSLRTFLKPGDEVIVPEPSFSLYSKLTLAADGDPVKVPLKDFTIDLEAIQKIVTSKTRMIFINNPNNPTGTCIKKDQFESFLETIPETTIAIIDEAYGDFLNAEDSPQGVDYIAGPQWIITLRTFSKAYGLAGLRIGYGIMSEGLAHYLNKVRQPFNVNSLALAAASAALDDEEHLSKTLNLVSEGLQFLYQELERLKIPYIPSQSNFLMIFLGDRCRQIYEALLREGVIVRPLSSFGYDEHIRVTVGTAHENERFIKTLEKIRSNG
jgi:histidinol-phosphate aminotransferase